MDGACWVCSCCWHSPVCEMNTRISLIRGMKCMHTQTRGWFKLSFEREASGVKTYINSRKVPSSRLPWIGLNLLLLFVGCLRPKQHANISQGQTYSDKCMCCHTVTEVADQNFYLTQSHYTNTRPTSPSADPIISGAWQGSHWTTNS